MVSGNVIISYAVRKSTHLLILSANSYVVLCDSGEVEDVKHFLVRCEEFRWERQRLVERIGQMEGTQEWLEEYWRAEEDGKMALLLGRSTQGDAGARVDECVSYGRSAEVVAEAEGVGIWQKSLLT